VQDGGEIYPPQLNIQGDCGDGVPLQEGTSGDSKQSEYPSEGYWTGPAAGPVPPPPAANVAELSEFSQGSAASVLLETPNLEAKSDYLVFGPDARLGPIPKKPVERQFRSFETVRDTAIDWLDDKLGSLRAVSVRGHIHRYLGEVRQDNFAFARRGNYLVLAVADGVGSAQASHLGSAVVSRLVVEDEALLNAIASAKTPGEVELRDISTTLRAIAAEHGLDESDVSTTLTLAIVFDKPVDSTSAETFVMLAQIGDSPAFKISAGEWIELRCPAAATSGSDLIDNSVEPLPGRHTASVWVEAFREGETLALVSDGVEDPVKSNSAYARALADLWRQTAPAPADLLKVLDATVKSFDDDRTIIGVRFGGRDS